MFKIITEIWSARGDEDVLIGSHLVGNATVAPSAKDKVVLRTTSRGGPHATTLDIRGVRTLSSHDGFVVTIWLEDLLADVEAAHGLRKELRELGWDFVMPEPPLPALADEDDFDEN